MRKLLALLLLVGLFGAVPARAQGGTTVRLYALDASAFPSMTALLDVYDASGAFVPGLASDAVTLLEDNQPHPLDTLEELQPGVRFVLAINPNPAFAARDSNGVSRMDKVMHRLQGWAAGLSATTPDDLSLVTTGGSTVSHLATGPAFQEALSAYLPDPRNLTGTLESLTQAIDIASEPGTQPGMKPAVLYVSSLPDIDTLPTLQGLTARAASMGIRVSVWIVASADFFTTGAATALKDLAINTGGQFAVFSGTETLPSPETYLSNLRHTYRLGYHSAIAAPGSHDLAVQVSLDGTPVASEPLTFEMDVQPPNPVLVSPPEQIVRRIPDPLGTNLSALQPRQQIIELLVDFPDAHPRPLVRTRLYVDGQLAAENTAAPFDRFAWDLSGYTSSGQHSLSVEALDSLGLSKTSLGVPVTITVVRPKTGLEAFLARNSLWVVLGAVAVAGAVLGITLTGGRRRRARRAGRRSGNDPLTQLVVGESSRRVLHLPWGGQRQGKPSLAYLVRLKEDGQPVTAPPIPLSAAETTFGTDPTLASYPLDDPSVSPLHARLKQAADGSFTLADQKSTAGTWVNFEQLTGPHRLQHGDVIHFGRLSYRFMLNKSPEQPKPRFTPDKR